MQHLLQNRCDTVIWEVAPRQIALTDRIRVGFQEAQFLFMCVPTAAHPELLREIVPYLARSCITLSVAKGVDDLGQNTADILTKQLSAAMTWGVLCGPMIANEIGAGKPAYAQAGMNRPSRFNEVLTLFSESALTLTCSSTPYALSWSAALKNVYAPLFGILEELSLGDNARGMLLMTVVSEMDRVVEFLTGERRAVYGEAGMADLMTTITSPSSHHRALGQRVARGNVSDMQAEGVHTLEILTQTQRIPAGHFPLYDIAAGLTRSPLQVADRLRAWFQAPIRI
jgi:glycerol-3-phosphate dehydrogenase (NAD(P)+)